MDMILNDLTVEEKEQLISLLQISIKSDKSKGALSRLERNIRESRFSKGFVCPHCGSAYVVRHGTYKGRQRYLCRNCKSTFSDLTNTPMSRTRFPDKWEPFIDCMLKGYSLRKSAEVLGVSHVTLFYWRHKILNALTFFEDDDFQGIVEMDETFFLHSEKGNKHITGRKPRKRGGKGTAKGSRDDQICVLVARDRCKQTVSKVATRGRISMANVDQAVGRLMSHENILCTDGLHGYRTFADGKCMEHVALTRKRVYKGIFHIQNVNNYHMRLKKWIDRFNGVSSKYLNNYLTWFKFLDAREFKDNGILIESCLHNTYDTNDSLRLAQFCIN